MFLVPVVRLETIENGNLWECNLMAPLALLCHRGLLLLPELGANANFDDEQ